MAARPAARRGAFCRDVYSLLHYVVIAGVVGVAVAVEKAVTHPAEPLPPAGVTALVAGVMLFVGGTAAEVARAGIEMPRLRLVAIAVLLAGAFLLTSLAATTALAVVAAVVALTALVEHRRHRIPCPVEA